MLLSYPLATDNVLLHFLKELYLQPHNFVLEYSILFWIEDLITPLSSAYSKIHCMEIYWTLLQYFLQYLFGDAKTTGGGITIWGLSGFVELDLQHHDCLC